MLKLESVGAAYGASPILNEIRLEINSGDAMALLGRNGVGKTTLLRTIAGLHPAATGIINFDGKDVTSLGAYERARRGIALVPQGRGIFPHLTVEENLTLGLSSLTGRDTPVRSIQPYIYDMFPVLTRLRTRKGGALSGGEQQQLAIGRALAAQPKLLLLDEPTEGIQPSIVQEIGNALTRIRKELKIAVILVEQFLRFAWSITDYYSVMQRGRIVRHGSTKSESPDTVAHLLNI
ncbi:MAG TPA: urea ABC transporter ATP-binding subunit UrtE [Candidatus Binataceae bacterium]|nr:urea ABC transporter ATP-binding subunit UrtE [Candidatus Binataceae bacterium]